MAPANSMAGTVNRVGGRPEFTVRRHKDQVADHSNVIDSLLADRHHCIRQRRGPEHGTDRKSTRLNSSHLVISYAVFCLKKKKHIHTRYMTLLLPIILRVTSLSF